MQLENTDVGNGVIGVIDCDSIEPVLLSIFIIIKIRETNIFRCSLGG